MDGSVGREDKLRELLCDPDIGRGADGRHLFDDVADRATHRLTNLYAALHDRDGASSRRPSAGEAIAAVLRMGRLQPFYETAVNQLPVVLRHEDVVAPRIGWTRTRPEAVEVEKCRLWLFGMPTGALVAGLSLDFHGTLSDAIPVLEDVYYADWTLDGRPASDVLCDWQDCSDAYRGRIRLGSHTHQLLFVAGRDTSLLRLSESEDSVEIDRDRVQRLVYRRDLPVRDNGSAIRYPKESNRNLSSVAACGPYVSVVAGQQDYIENAMLVSAVQLVASGATLAAVRNEAYATLSRLRTLSSTSGDAVQGGHRGKRTELARMSEILGRLEIELSFGVEAYCETSAVVPSLRVSDFHRTLYEASEIHDQAAGAGQMLERLQSAIAAERESVISAERHHDERRAATLSVAGGFLSLIAVAFGMAFAFFGVNTPDVTGDHSMLDVGHYWQFYAVTAASVLSTVCVAVIVWIVRRDPDG